MGLMLYNVREAKNSLDFKAIHILQDLEEIDAVRIKELETLVSMTHDQFLRRFGVAEEGGAMLADLFWCLNQSFALNANKSQFRRQAFLFTTEDDPVGSSPEAKQAAVQRALDMQNQGVELQLLALTLPPEDLADASTAAGADSQLGSESVASALSTSSLPSPSQAPSQFDLSKFYLDVLTLDDADDADEYLALSSVTLTTLRDRVRQKQYAQRRLGRLMLKLSADVSVGAAMYTLVLPQRKPTAVKLTKTTNAVVVSEVVYTSRERGVDVNLATDTETYLEFGGDLVRVSQDERAKLQHFAPPGLTLLGFKDARAVPFDLNIGNGVLLRPDDEQVTGSTALFSALCRSLQKKQKVAIVRSVPRVNSTPRFAALFPQLDGVCEGLVLVPLPYADDIRHLDLPNSTVPAAKSPEEADQRLEQTRRAKMLLKAARYPGLRAGQSLPWVENPSLQKFWAGLESLALNSATGGASSSAATDDDDDAAADGVNAYSDSLRPDARVFDKMTALGVEFLDHVDPHRRMHMTAAPAKRPARPIPGAADGATADEVMAGAAPKRVKPPTPDLDDTTIKNMFQANTLAKLTVDQLKGWLATKHVKTTGMKKADLVQAATNAAQAL